MMGRVAIAFAAALLLLVPAGRADQADGVLYVDNDGPEAAAWTLDGAPQPEAPPRLVQRLRVAPGVHTLTHAGRERTFQAAEGTATVFNPGGNGVYDLLSATYARADRFAPGKGPRIAETVIGEVVFTRDADFGLDAPFPAALQEDRFPAERTRLRKRARAPESADHAFAMLAQPGQVYEGPDLDAAFGLLREKSDPRLSDAAVAVLSQARLGAPAQAAEALARARWTPDLADHLVEAAAGLDSPDGRGNARRILMLLLEGEDEEGAKRRVREAPAPARRALLAGLAAEGGEGDYPKGAAARVCAEILLEALTAEEGARAWAVSGLAALAPSLREEELRAAVEAAEALEDRALAGRAARAFARAARKGAPEGLEAFLAGLQPGDSPEAAAEALARFPAAEAAAAALKEVKRRRAMEPVLLPALLGGRGARYADVPEVAAMLVPSLRHDHAGVRHAAFESLLARSAAWPEGAEEALRAAAEADPALGPRARAIDLAADQGRRARAAEAAEGGDLAWLLEHFDDPDARRKASETFREKDLTDAEVKAIAARFEAAAPAERRQLCEAFLPNPSPGLLKLAAWGYATGKAEREALGWFDRSTAAGNLEASFALFDLWKAKRGASLLMPPNVRLPIARVYEKGLPADMLALSKALCAEAANGPAPDGLRLLEMALGGDAACAQAAAVAAKPVLSDTAAETRALAVGVLAKAAGRASPPPCFKEACAAWMAEQDPKARRGMEGAMEELLEKALGQAAEADAQKAVKTACDEARKASARDRFALPEAAATALGRQKSEAAKRSCWKELGNFAAGELDDEDAKVRRKAVDLLEKAADVATPPPGLKELRNAAGKEKDAALKARMASALKRLERK